MNLRQTHEQGLVDLFMHAQKLGFRGNYLIAKEIRFMQGRQVRSEPDLMILQGSLCTLVEYKTSGTPEGRRRAHGQLNRAEKYLRDNKFRYDRFRKLYIPGDGSIEELE